MLLEWKNPCLEWKKTCLEWEKTCLEWEKTCQRGNPFLHIPELPTEL